MCLGVPGQIVHYEDGSRQTALVDFNGTRRIVNTGMMASDEAPAGPGDWVLVHMDIALHQVEPDEAADTQSFFDDLLMDFERIAAERHDAAEAGNG